MRENINAIEYWYPKIKDIVPTPQTMIIFAESNWDKTGNFKIVPDKYVQAILKEAEKFDFPIFLRASDSSIKHDWKDTCFVECKEDLKKRIQRIANECESLDVFGGVSVSSFAIREYIEMDSKFTAFWGDMPVNPERRYFINEGKILCRHPYWFEGAIEQIPRNLPTNWRDLLKGMNIETNEEISLLTSYANKIAKVFKDYWSVDFCKAKTGKWYCIDMASGKRSWHPKCKEVI